MVYTVHSVQCTLCTLCNGSNVHCTVLCTLYTNQTPVVMAGFHGWSPVYVLWPSFTGFNCPSDPFDHFGHNKMIARIIRPFRYALHVDYCQLMYCLNLFLNYSFLL